MRTKEELNDYSLKIKKIAKYQKEANEYKKNEIFSGVIAGLVGVINVYLISTLKNPSNLHEIENFLASIGYSFLTAGALYNAIVMRNKKEEYEDKVYYCEKGLKG